MDRAPSISRSAPCWSKEIASFQVGGGIVADSDPEAEYEETLAKGKGMLAVLDPGRGKE